ncbi:hypothetical protein FOA52_012942 [Chlamydomonas sp. UWO 241]|nr:hypothetical protein FOA52_012942 [Chlamydomonas sp. UWO 241]
MDGSIKVVASPRDGFSAADLTVALRTWPRIVDLTLLGVINPTVNLGPLITSTVARLTRLTVREAHGPGVPAEWPMPVLSSTVAATLQVIDFSCCLGLTSIDAVRSCVQLRVLWMPYVMSLRQTCRQQQQGH